MRLQSRNSIALGLVRSLCILHRLTSTLSTNVSTATSTTIKLVSTKFKRQATSNRRQSSTSYIGTIKEGILVMLISPPLSPSSLSREALSHQYLTRLPTAPISSRMTWKPLKELVRSAESDSNMD